MKVEESSRCIKPDATVIDGGGMLHKVHWPPNGIVKDLVDGIDHYVRMLMLNTDVYLIFDCYKTGSIKSDTRTARVAAFQRSHHLSLERELPSKDVVLPSSSTKENLIELISSELYTRFETNKFPKRFVVASKNPVPEQLQHGVRTKRRSLTSYYDEADYIMPQQVHSILKEERKKSVKVLSSDTVVFVLLCFHFANHWAPKDVYMDPFSGGSKLISIKKSVNTKQHIMPSLVALHAISRCDTVPMIFGIGKVKSLKVFEKVPLVHIGEVNAELEEVIDEGKRFVAKCYGQVETSSSKNRQTIWINKTNGVKKTAKPPALQSLPPTDEALEINIKRAHYVTILWKTCITGTPHELEPLEYGWEKDGESLRPIMLPDRTDAAPEKVLQMTRCKCSSSQCKTNRCSCSCVKTGTNCSEFSGCQDCENQKDLEKSESEDENDMVDYEEEDIVDV